MLEKDFNILTYDLRGHGWSKKYQNYVDYNIACLAEDLRALLGHLCIRSCTLVSHSLGTLVALLFIRSNPGRVRRNLLLSPIYRVGAPAMTIVLNLLPRIASRYGGRDDYSRLSHARDFDLRRLILEIKRLTLRIYLFYLHQMGVFPHHAAWSVIDVPTTIMHGTKDSFAPYRLATELAKIVPNSQLITLEGANHMIIVNNRDDVAAQIRVG
jgi:pimeloyl-ACP methyl ester carboxylesterase